MHGGGGKRSVGSSYMELLNKGLSPNLTSTHWEPLIKEHTGTLGTTEVVYCSMLTTATPIVVINDEESRMWWYLRKLFAGVKVQSAKILSHILESIQH